MFYFIYFLLEIKASKSLAKNTRLIYLVFLALTLTDRSRRLLFSIGKSTDRKRLRLPAVAERLFVKQKFDDVVMLDTVTREVGEIA